MPSVIRLSDLRSLAPVEGGRNAEAGHDEQNRRRDCPAKSKATWTHRASGSVNLIQRRNKVHMGEFLLGRLRDQSHLLADTPQLGLARGALLEMAGERVAVLSFEQIVKMLEQLGPDLIARLHPRVYLKCSRSFCSALRICVLTVPTGLRRMWAISS